MFAEFKHSKRMNEQILKALFAGRKGGTDRKDK